MKKKSVRLIAMMLLIAWLLSLRVPGLAEAISKNPLIDPKLPEAAAQTEDRYFHLLLLGIDYGMEGYWGSGLKQALDQCHTDAVMVASLNLDHPSLSLISIPRDTVTYVPGIHGIYKLNAAVNCADNLKDGMGNICAAVSWLMGGIEIDHYIAVDMRAMIALGDAIGGVDFDMDMDYVGHSGIHYRKGMQHLDGQGMMDYLRARKNATVNANDLGRTSRQRAMMTAVFRKLRGQLGLMNAAMTVLQDENQNVFKNVHREDLAAILPVLLKLDLDDVGSYSLTGPYRTALDGWNFTFTDQDNRISVLRNVYGLEAEPIPYVSYAYTKWLMEDGMASARSILLARKVLEFGMAIESPTDLQQSSLAQLSAAHDAAVAAFDQAADALDEKSTADLIAARKILRDAANQAAKTLDYPESLPWNTGKAWYNDSLINEYRPDWR